MRSSTFKSPPRSVWRPLVWWAKLPLLPRGRNARNAGLPVVTPAILETHGRVGPTLQAFLAKIAPEDQQARATWLQDATRRISCVLQIHNARIIAECSGSI